MKITDISIKKPVSTLTITIGVILFGLLALSRMGIEQYPQVDFPMVTVTTVLQGASPEVMDADVTDVIEEQIKTLSGIKSLSSQSFESVSSVVVEFELGKDVDVAAQEVRAKVNLAERDLPDDVEKPIIDKLDLNAMEIMWIPVYGNVDYATLVNYADHVLKEQLQSVSGVGNINLGGLRQREIRVWLDPNKLKARNLTSLDVIRAISLKHIELPGGRIETATTEFSIKVEGEYQSVDELRNLVVAEREGSRITLSDLGRVDDGFEDLRSIVRYNGQPSIGLGVRKQSGTNTNEVAAAVLARLEQVKELAPEGVQVDVAFNSAKFVEESIEGVKFDLIFGIILTALVMFLFLRNVRITFISIVAIPVSLIGALTIMQALGFTLNYMTMLALSLAVGMVIDDTIVVLENIFRHVEEGKDRVTAARIGTAEVGLAVIAATSTIAAVFIPVAFMKGIIGRFFYQFGLTVALTIIISVIVSLTLTPFLFARISKPTTRHSKLYNTIENGLVKMESGYRRSLEWALAHRKSIVAISIAAFVGGIGLVPMIGSEMSPNADTGDFIINFELPTGTSVEQTNRRLYEMEQLIFNMPEVDHSFTAVGANTGGEVNKGLMIVSLVDKQQRSRDQHEVMAAIRKALTVFDDSIISVSYLNGMGGGSRNADVTLILKGPDVEKLAAVSDKIVAELNAQPVFNEVDTDLRITKPDVKININRGLSDDLGVNVQSISSEIYALFGGVETAKFKEGGYRYNIRVKALPEFRMTPEDLQAIAVRAGDGTLIDASNLISYEVSRGPNVINRFDRMRSVTLYANVNGISPGEGLEQAIAIVEQNLPADGNWGYDLSGESRSQQETFGYLVEALIIAVLLIYMILCIQFESFLQPLTMMISLPFSMVGVFGALLLSGMTLNIFSFIGIIMLMGIVTKNGILLVDFANQQREKGVDKVQAMLNAGSTRLRPILMTALTVVASVVPVALGLSEGGETRAPMAVAVIGGMISSTLLTLLVVPVVYVMLENIKERFSKGENHA